MKRWKIPLLALAGLATITVLHIWLNIGFSKLFRAETTAEKFKVGFLPVTCHLTCPVTDWINTNMEGEGFYQPVRFGGWPELKEAHISGATPATFLLAPLAMKLRQDGVPIKIVYLGHRDGTALMVHKDSDIHTIQDLKGKVVAVPNRFSNQYLIIFKALRDVGLNIKDVQIRELPPPDMPVALREKAVDAITSGEPFMGQTELDGYGRVLFQARELWPNFISCVLTVREDMIAKHPDQVQKIVDGIAKSGKWLDKSMDNRMSAAEVVATTKRYYNQDPRLLKFVLSKPPDRVTYTKLALAKADFNEIMELAVAAGVLSGPIAFEEYADIQFSDKTHDATPHAWEVKK